MSHKLRAALMALPFLLGLGSNAWAGNCRIPVNDRVPGKCELKRTVAVPAPPAPTVQAQALPLPVVKVPQYETVVTGSTTVVPGSFGYVGGVNVENCGGSVQIPGVAWNNPSSTISSKRYERRPVNLGNRN